MRDISNRAEPKVFVHQTLNHCVSFAEGNMHLHSSLTVPKVVNLLVCNVVDVFEDCGQIIVGHVLEGKCPKLGIFVRVVLGVSP